jgi:hypothetical protein
MYTHGGPHFRMKDNHLPRQIRDKREQYQVCFRGKFIEMLRAPQLPNRLVRAAQSPLPPDGHTPHWAFLVFIPSLPWQIIIVHREIAKRKGLLFSHHVQGACDQ